MTAAAIKLKTSKHTGEHGSSTIWEPKLPFEKLENQLKVKGDDSLKNYGNKWSRKMFDDGTAGGKHQREAKEVPGEV